MSDAEVIIAACGDRAVDVYQETIPHPRPAKAMDKDDYNWYGRPGHRQYRLGGGVFLLSEMIKRAVRQKLPRLIDASFKLPEFDDFESNIVQPEIVQALAHIVEEHWDEKYGPKPDDHDKAWFIDRFHGFSLLPASKHSPVAKSVSSIEADAQGPRIAVAVLDDGGNGFRDDQSQWPDWLNDENQAFGLVILKLSPPLRTRISPISPLFERFTSMKAGRKVIVLNGVDLRDERAGISGKLSWERTAADLVRFIEQNRASYSLLSSDADLIIRFGIEGTAYVTRRAIEGGESVYLIADPSRIENSVDIEIGYEMAGCTSAFVAAMVASGVAAIADGGLSDWSVIKAINDAMDPAFLLRTRGMRVTAADHSRMISFPELIFDKAAYDPKAKVVKIPKRSVFELKFSEAPKSDASSGPSGGIADSFTLRPIASAAAPSELFPPQDTDVLAQAVVLRGETALEAHTHAKFGKMLQVDWREVEAYRYVANLMRKYLNGEENRPLSLAVFGAPGSGKSYGITEISKTMSGTGKGPTIPQLTFNVAQWRSADDLHAALHQVRDRTIAGDVPLVFFDEFDSATNVELGWLKLFLAPMQDGEFSDGKHVHKIGKAIFVFAGGTKNTYDEFNVTSIREGEASATDEQSSYDTEAADRVKMVTIFKNAKGPDFISRLSGYVNIQNLDQSEQNQIWMLRRAVVLRGLLEKHLKSIFDRTKKADFDVDVLNAFLTVPSFNHGIRSMEAILRMSSANASSVRFAKADLPPTSQLALHVDPTGFLNAAKIL